MKIIKEIIKIIVSLSIGIMIGVTIMSIPKIKYDLNNDNNVSVVDVVMLLNYIKGEE